PKHKFDKHRDQYEYDSIRTIGKELDLILDSRDISEVIHNINRAQEMAKSRMVTLRIVEGYGWDIASVLPDAQYDWMKSQEKLIEKAK
ncbi:2553_t:CDS:1, partial [Acaulospora colombiana]